jgi:hypothetical protein
VRTGAYPTPGAIVAARHLRRHAVRKPTRAPQPVNQGRSLDLQPPPPSSLHDLPPTPASSYLRSSSCGSRQSSWVEGCVDGDRIGRLGGQAIRLDGRLGARAISLDAWTMVGAKNGPQAATIRPQHARQVASEHRLTTKLTA